MAPRGPAAVVKRPEMGNAAQRTGRRRRKALEDGASAPSANVAESQAALGIRGLGTEATVNGGAEPCEHLGLVVEAGAPHESLAGALPASSRAEASVAGAGAEDAGR
jgi:hypothetical protein